ncbi:MAG: ABC transporter permease [Planctomycetia bacterium]|jgi:putative ABC transport system permease protein|nr:ABC transporter permease [Planctomycetia bacterium]
MLFWTTIKIALRSMSSNKLRSILTMLGMILGVAAVIAMLALGNGAKQHILKWVSRMGKNTITIFPHNPKIPPVLHGAAYPLTIGDARAMLKIPGVKYVSPVVASNEPVKWGGNFTNCNTFGCAPTYIIIHDFQVQSGRMFNDYDCRDAASVAVIGPETAERLFGSQDPLGHTITVRTVRFKVIGVLVPKGRQGWFDPDNQVLLPYTTAMTDLLGRDAALNRIDMQAWHASDLNRVQMMAQKILRVRHALISGDEDDFWISNQLQIIKISTRIVSAFTMLLGSVAGISLLVGGIGIMNIMLVTVTERTREIGIRKAIGARQRDILRQFLIEATLISVLGGLIGVAVGVAGAHYVKFRNFSGQVEPHMVILALSISAAIGIFFGYYPARRAAGLNPIEALRYE